MQDQRDYQEQISLENVNRCYPLHRIIEFEPIDSEAYYKLPTRSHNSDAGLDLYAAEDVLLTAFKRKVVPTNLRYRFIPEIGEAFMLQIRERSGLSVKTGLEIHAGIVDHTYRGNLGIVVKYIPEADLIEQDGMYIPQFTKENATYKIKRGDKIAQAIVTKIICPRPVEAEAPLPLNLQRGDKGFGSSGK